MATGRAVEDTLRPRAGSEEMFDPAETISGYERSPEDLLRLLVAATVAIAVLLLTKLLSEAVGGLQNDFVELLAIGSAELLRVLEGLLGLISVSLGLLTLLLPLLTRRFRTFGYVFVASVVCSALMAAADAWLGITGSINDAARDAGLSVGVLPDASAIAQNAAAIVVFAPFVTRRWRQTLWSLFAAMLVLSVLISVHPPAATVIALAIGPAVGSATLLAFGRPTSRPTLAAIVASLDSAGLPVTDIEPAAVDARGSTPYFADGPDGERLFVKVLGANERAADLLFRLYRRLRLRNVGDERPDSSLRRTVEHEALVSLQARDVGVRTPRMRAVASVGQDSFLLSYDLIAGSSLDGVATELITDQVLEALWRQVGVLRRHRIAHRDLRLANVFLDDTAEPWIIDFGFAEVAASETLLDADVAQLLASLSVAVGAPRAVGTAITGLGAEAVAGSVGRLQLVALSGATQTALKEHAGLLDELRAEIVRRCGIDEPQLDPLTRLHLTNGAILTISGLLLYGILPIVVGLDSIGEVMDSADWSELVPLAAVLAVALLAKGWELYSVPPLTLPAWPTFLAATASVFATSAAPANLGGRSLTTRYLERHGLQHSRAAAASSLVGATNTAALIALLLVFLIWAGRRSFDSVDVDRPAALWTGLAIVLLLALVLFAIPPLRRRMLTTLREAASQARRGLDQLSGSPSRLATTAAAALLLVLAWIASLGVALSTFMDPMPVATVGLVLVSAMLVAKLLPTPGHLLGTEVLLIAGLVAAGQDLASITCAVLLHRLATFWIPAALGAGAFRVLRHTSHL